MAAAWFVLLGPVRATIDGQPVEINRAQRRAVLAYLLLQANRAVSTEELIDALWGPYPPATARSQVFAAVSAVRRALRAAGRDPVSSQPGGYRVDVDPDELDLATFQRLVLTARQRADRSAVADASTTLRRALRLWQGTPLSGITGAFVDTARSSLLERRVEAMELLYGYELTLGRHQAVLAELTELTAAHPYREALVVHLMLALHRSGRSADALAAFRRMRDQLVTELGIEPSSELELLHKGILGDDPTLRFTRDRPPVTGGPCYLPRDIPDFTGRTRDLDALDRLAEEARDAPGTVMISAIGGVAGVGKTALATRWAHRSADRYPDGQLYLNLRGYDERSPMRPAEALGSLLRALDVPAERIPPTTDEAAALYRATIAERRTLVLLDNARSVEQVRPLLPAGAGTLVLITSRDALTGLVARDGARRLDLDVLPAEDAVRLLAAIVGAERVTAEPHAARELAASCGYLPLALRIAAANLAATRDRTLAAYHADLARGPRLPGLTVADDPMSNLQTVFAYSYRALSAPAQRLFRLLGLVPGRDFTVDAVAALCGTSPAEAQPLLEALGDAYLVSERPAAEGTDEPARYTMHDLLQEYAARLAAAPERADERREGRDRLVDWTFRHVDGAARRLYPAGLGLASVGDPADFPDSASASRWLDGEFDNLLALTVSAAALGRPEAAWRIPFACRSYLFLRGGRATMIRMARAGLAAAAQEKDSYGQAAAELVLAQAYNLAGHDDRALRHAHRCLARAREAGWRHIEIDAYNAVSVHHLHLGDLRASAQAARTAFEISRELGVTSTQHLGKLGLTSLLLGDLHEACGYLEQTLAAQAGLANHSRGITLLNLGEAHRLQGRYADAGQRIVQAIGLFEEVGSSYLAAVAQCGLALVHLADGRLEQAQAASEAARTVLEDSGDDLARTQMWHAQARVLAECGQITEAVQVLRDALAVARTLPNGHPATQLMTALAEAECVTGHHEVAEELASRAAEAARTGQFAILEAQALDVLAIACLERGRTAAAGAAARRAVAIGERTGYRGLRYASMVLDRDGAGGTG
jgi:DNA-binding SARP family transcriptional activator